MHSSTRLPFCSKTLALFWLRPDHVRKYTRLSMRVYFAFQRAWERGYMYLSFLYIFVSSIIHRSGCGIYWWQQQRATYEGFLCVFRHFASYLLWKFPSIRYLIDVQPVAWSLWGWSLGGGACGGGAINTNIKIPGGPLLSTSSLALTGDKLFNWHRWLHLQCSHAN